MGPTKEFIRKCLRASSSSGAQAFNQNKATGTVLVPKITTLKRRLEILKGGVVGIQEVWAMYNPQVDYIAKKPQDITGEGW